jgi:hypothetical protein
MKMNVVNIHGGNVKNGIYIFWFEHSKGRKTNKNWNDYLFRLNRHGSPANLPKGQSSDRVEFANFYLKGFSGMKPMNFNLFHSIIFSVQQRSLLLFLLFWKHTDKRSMSHHVLFNFLWIIYVKGNQRQNQSFFQFLFWLQCSSCIFMENRSE